MINFEAEKVEMPLLDFGNVSKWLQLVAEGFSMKIGNLNYLFCDDATILEVNRKFLGHDYFTDIITFDYSTPSRLAGDLYISLDTVRSNSEILGVSNNSELLRVIVHGLLHLCGINDKGEGERLIMESHEDKALALWDSVNRM